MNNVIDKIVKRGKCMRCGGCTAACPERILSAAYNSKTGFFDIRMETDRCCECQKCLKVCPAGKEDYNKKYLGNYKRLCLTFSNEKMIRRDATSGGSINEICRFLLETNQVDYVLLVKNDWNEKILSKAEFVDKAEILKNSPRQFASRYVSLPVCSSLKEADKSKRYAVVGTPCQIASAKRILGAQSIYVGVACSEGISFKATERYLKHINAKNVKNIFYRGNGWPGQTAVYHGSGRITKQEHYHSDFNAIYSSQVYRNRGCRYCHDQFAEEADISFFDFWNSKEVREEKYGKTGTIVRTEKGEKILRELEADKRLCISGELKEEEVIDCQEWIVLLKKCYWKHWVVKGYYFLTDVLKLLKIEKFLAIWQYRLLGKVFRKVIYVLKIHN